METARAARRELGLVLALATCGIALALLAVLAPWYEPGATSGRAAVVQTYPPVPAQAQARVG